MIEKPITPAELTFNQEVLYAEIDLIIGNQIFPIWGETKISTNETPYYVEYYPFTYPPLLPEIRSSIRTYLKNQFHNSTERWILAIPIDRDIENNTRLNPDGQFFLLKATLLSTNYTE